MGAPWRSLVLASLAGLVVAGCHPWPEREDGVIPCTDARRTVTGTISPAGDSILAGYARVVFPSGAFDTATFVTMMPYEGLHAFHLEVPTRDPSPPFDAYFYLDVCDARTRQEPFQIMTARVRQEGAAETGVDSIERPGRGLVRPGPRPYAWRRIEAGELDDPQPAGAGVVPLPVPVRGGFVVLGN